MKNIFYTLIFTITCICSADTFTNKKTGETFTGYATTRKVEGKNMVKTVEAGYQKLDLENYEVVQDKNGRKEEVIFIPLRNAIEFLYETEAFCEALEKTADNGPLFIVIDVDSPGGRVDLCKMMCEKILDIQKRCPVYAYVSGGPCNGAYSSAAGVSLACQRIYMTPDTAIGAATPYMRTQAGLKSDDEFRKTFSEYFGWLAKEHNKPVPLAMAMVDKDFSVVEVEIDGQRHFWSKELKRIHPKPKNAKDQEDGTFIFTFPPETIRYTWSEKGAIVTLSAQDAQKTGIADAIFDSQATMFQELGYESAKLKYNKAPEVARKEFQKMQMRTEKTIARIQNRINNWNRTVQTRDEAIAQASKLSKELGDILGLAEKYEELHINREKVEMLHKMVQDFLHSL